MSTEVIEQDFGPDVFAITDSGDLAGRLRQASQNRCTVVGVEPFPVDAPSFFTRIGEVDTPKVVILDPGVDSTPAFNLLARLKAARLGFAVILVSGSARDVGLAALRAGFCDVLERNAPTAELVDALERARQVNATEVAAQQSLGIASTPTPNVSAPAGRVISIVSPKGGVGKTTVSTNLAVGLSAGRPGAVVLVDLDTQFGDVSSGLDLNPEFTIVHVVSKPSLRDPVVMKSFLTRHSTGLSVVCGVENPAEADSFSSAQVEQMLKMLASEFEFVVIDTAPGLTDHTLAAMDVSTDLVLVTSMDVPGVRGMRKELDALSAIGMVHANTHIVLNMADEQNGIALADVEATIRRPVDVSIPRSRAAATAVNEGVPLLQNGGKDPATVSLRNLTGRFVEMPVDAKTRDKSPDRPRRAASLLSGLTGQVGRR